jgi:hypothetical protein
LLGLPASSFSSSRSCCSGRSISLWHRMYGQPPMVQRLMVSCSTAIVPEGAEGKQPF